MLLTVAEHYDYLDSLLDQKPRTVIISTQNVFAGITIEDEDQHKWGAKYQKRARFFIDSLGAINDVRILIGVQKYHSCRQDAQCDHCVEQRVMNVRKLINHVNRWSNIKWKYEEDFQLKCSLFVYQDNRIEGVVGTRNLTDTDWDEVTFPVKDLEARTLFKKVFPIWQRARTITTDSMIELTNRQVNAVKYK